MLHGRLILAGIRPQDLTARDFIHVCLALIVDNELSLDKETAEAREKGLKAIAAIPEQKKAQEEAEARGHFVQPALPGMRELPEGGEGWEDDGASPFD